MWGELRSTIEVINYLSLSSGPQGLYLHCFSHRLHRVCD